MTLSKPSYVTYVLLVLLAVHANDMWSDFLTVYLYAVSDEGYDDDNAKDFVSMADATGMSESEYGVLVGFGFTLSFVLFGLIMGRAVDVYNRKLILFFNVVIWNLATVFQGLSNNYTQVLLARVLNGAGQGANLPAGFSIIADLVPAEDLAKANGIFASGIYIGEGLSSLSIAIAEAIGWRAACYSIATSGFLLALVLLLTVKEPVRAPATTSDTTVERPEPVKIGQGTRDPQEDRIYTVRQSLAFIFKEPLFVLVIVGGMLRFTAMFTVESFLPDFYSQIYPDDNTAYSYLNAVVVSIGGALSSYLGGCAVDRWEKAGEKRARMYIPAIGALVGIPLFFMAIVIPSFYMSIFFLFLEYLLSECWYGPIVSVLQKFLPPRVRGVGVGCFTFFMMIAGSTMASVTGFVLEAHTSDYAIKLTMILIVCGMMLASAAIFLTAARFMPDLDSGSLKGSLREPLLSNGDNEPEPDSNGVNPPPNGNGDVRTSSSAWLTI